MSPVRLFILAVLFYIAWRLFQGSKKKKAGNKQGQDGSSQVEDVLLEDPVCHTLVPKKQAIRLRKDGKTYYFCSEKCCDTFIRESEGRKE